MDNKIILQRGSHIITESALENFLRTAAISGNPGSFHAQGRFTGVSILHLDCMKQTRYFFMPSYRVIARAIDLPGRREIAMYDVLQPQRVYELVEEYAARKS